MAHGGSHAHGDSHGTLREFALDFVMGGLAAGVAKTAAAPIERVKLLIQNQDELLKQGRLSHPYKGITDCFARTVAGEGVVSLWRGNLPNIIRYVPTQALNFAFKDQLKHAFAVPATDPYWKSLGANVASGGLAGTASLCFVYSLDYARTRLANDTRSSRPGAAAGEREFSGLVDVYRKTLASDGIAGLYRGFAISVLGVFIYRGIFFGVYDSLKPALGAYEDAFLANFLLGWGVTIVATQAAYPIDTVRRRMMMTSGQAVKYNGARDAFAQIVAKEGAASLFKGAGANVIRGVAGAGVLAGYDQLQVLAFGKAFSGGGG